MIVLTIAGQQSDCYTSDQIAVRHIKDRKKRVMVVFSTIT